jgi:hypothetical protein
MFELYIVNVSNVSIFNLIICRWLLYLAITVVVSTNIRIESMLRTTSTTDFQIVGILRLLYLELLTIRHDYRIEFNLQLRALGAHDRSMDSPFQNAICRRL